VEEYTPASQAWDIAYQKLLDVLALDS
jgi:hypothetical protein